MGQRSSGPLSLREQRGPVKYLCTLGVDRVLKKSLNNIIIFMLIKTFTCFNRLITF